ncbi:MAG: Lrp/AsnC family transcriptional regulator, partial [Nanoarchaeota archaeon]
KPSKVTTILNGVDTNVFLFSEWDVEILVWVKKPGEFYDFYNKIIDLYSEYMASKDFSIVTKIHFLANDYLHKTPYSITIGDMHKIESIDEDDEKILEEIKKDPRQELISIAANLNLSFNTVQYRLKQLYTKNILKGIIPVVNISLLGYNRYKVELVLSKQAQRNKVIDYLKTRNEVTNIAEIIGRNDMSFEANFRTNAELDKFLEDLRVNSSNIQNFEVMNMIVE